MVLNRLFKTTAFRLIVIYLLVIIVGSIAVGAYVSWKTNTLMSQQLIETISAEVKGLAEQYRTGGSAQLARAIGERSRRPGNSLYFYGAHKGAKIAGNMNRIPASLIKSSGGAQFEYVWRQDEIREVRHAVGVPFHVAGNLVLVVGRDIEAQLEFSTATRNMFFIGLGALAVFGLGAGLWVSRNLLNRINTITATSKSIMAGDLSERIPVNGSDDELDRLSANLNSMLSRIETLMMGMREVTDNIAHDLKTPINRIRIGAEEALIAPKGKGAQREALQATIEEADNLIKTFNALLKIARLEAGADNEQKDHVDLAQVINEMAELYEPVIDDANMNLVLSSDISATILADRQLVSQAIANLVDNAIKYSFDEDNPEAKKNIELGIERFGERVRVIIADQGEGISDHDRSRVFDRFVRLEDSRSKPGSGLGLSMVAAIVKAYGGTIDLQDNEPGLRVVLSFPEHVQTLAA